MKLNPQQAPLYGECLLTVQLCDEERFQDEEDVEFYLLFSGTTQRHLTSTLRISHVTLQAICPAHDCCESVQVTLCSAKPGRPVDTVAEERFQFVQDLAFDMAQFLVSTAGQDDGLEGALLLDECQIPLQECERLDESLALALRHLTLPEGWSVLGTNLGKDFVPAPQETLLHFAARRGLRRVAVFLLQQPGGKEALKVPNKQGATPASVAENRGHRQLQQLLTPEETAQRTRTEGSVKISEGRVVRHHRKLNTYTLTVDTKPGYPLPSLQSDVEELRRVIHCHVELKGAPSSQPEYESPWPTQENSDSKGSAIEESCLDQLQHDSVHTTEQRSEEAQCIGQPSQAGPDPGPDASEPCSGNGDVGESTHPCQSSSGEEEGVVPAAVSVGDSGKVLDKSDTTQNSERPAFSTPSCGKQEEEADIVWDIISVPQSSTEGLDNGRPEEERGEERTGKTKGQTDGGAPGCSGNGPAEGDMGHAQSQEQLETADADVEGREPSQEAEQDGEKAKGTVSGREGEPESESERPLSSPAPAENGQEDSKEMQDIKPYPECPQSETAHLICCEKEPKVAVNGSDQSQEAAAVDCYKEKEGGDSEEKNNLTPQPEKGVCEESCASPETETGNLRDEANGSSKSAHSTGAEPLQPESTEECLTQAGEEGSSIDANPPVSVRLAQDDDQITCDPQTESAESKDKPADHGEENTTEECQQENQRGVPECQVESTEVQLTQNDVTSSSSSCHSQVASSSTDKREGDAIPEGFASSSEDFLSSTSPVAEPLHLPPASGDTSTMQEASSLGQEETSMASQMDQALNLSDSVSNFEATNETEKEEEESMISPIIEPDLQLLPSEDTKETLKLEFPPELLRLEPEKEGKQSEQIQECVGITGFTSLTDRANNLASSLERVDEEESEEIGESKPVSEEISSMTQMEEKTEAPDGDVVDGLRESTTGMGTDTGYATKIHREKDTFYSIDPCDDQNLLEKKSSSECPESPLCQTPGSSVSTTQLDSVSDADGFFSTDTGEDSVFRKTEDTVTGDSTSEVSVSCSSTDDTASVGPPSSTPDSCADGNRRWSSEEARQPGAATGGEAEEEKDRLTEVPVRSAILRSSIRSLSPFRRHSWGPGKNPGGEAEMNQRSYSLEGLTADRDGGKDSPLQGASPRDPRRMPRQESEERGSLVSLTEEEQESDLGECSSLDSQKSGGLRPARQSSQSMTLPLTKSVSMLAISQKELDGMRSFSSVSGALGYSISEEDPGPLRSDSEGKGGTKVSRTFSYLKSKMYKKTKEKDKDRSRDKEKEAKEREKRTLNGHLFSALNSALPVQCYQCNKAINTKDASYCTYCNAYVHKGCKEILPICTKVKMKQQKQQLVVTDSAAMPPVTLRNKTTPSRERPWSAISAPDEPALVMGPRRHTSIMTFNSNLSSNLSKSISISNIAGPVFDEMPLKGLRYLSQSTDSLHKTSKVNESTESLTDEGTEMMDSQLMGEFEADAKELEADSWSCTQDKKYLKQLKKDVIKRQDVIYELIQTEMHHLRTLKIMADVYSKGLLKEVQLEVQTVERVFPVLDDLLDLHTNFFSLVLERKKEAQKEGKDGNFIIRKIGDVLVMQFSGSNAERMKKVYGKFCSRHNEAVNFYKELHTKDKRFQAFIKKKMSSTIVRRLGIPECILLVTQRITKYPVLLQRILEHTKENEEDHGDVTQALRLVKEVIAAVDSKVNEHEKKRRLKEVYSRTDSKSIMRMKSGQMFAREDLVRGRRRLLHDGPLQLKNSTGRLKEVQALLLSDIFVFLQEKDQKYVFASLDQRSTVISLQKLIVREVANEEKGLFLITAGIEKPEMVEVYASSKEERNTWMQLIQEAMHSMEKDEDEGIPSETEEDKRLLETKAKEMRDLLRKKDEQIVVLLEEKVKLFRDMCDCGTSDDSSLSARTLFRANAEDMPKGEPVMKDALKEVETLQTLVNGSLGGAMGQLESAGGSVGPVCLPRRAETFGGFDSHQMNISKNGDKDEGEDSADLRRTESDSVLKKGGNANLLLLLKRNSEQVLHSVTHLHDLLNTLQAVVVQQDTFIEDQRQALSERPASRPSSRPSSLIEQEKQRSLEKQRQEVANLQRQQAAHAEERRRREREWEAREQALGDREAVLHMQEEEAQRKRKELEEERQELQARKEEYQKDLERLRDAQRKLEKDKEQVRREQERIEQIRLAEEKKMCRTPSTTSEDSLLFQSSSSLDRDMGECELSSSPRKDSFGRMDSKRKVKNFFPATSNASQKAPGGEGQNQIPNRLMSLAKSKDKKDKKKKKGKGHNSQPTESPHVAVSDQALDGEIFFC
ncbi:hypothetical protein AGOR_G00166440 [Albula goreensis]|uniref:A-kinase anchor protein 13 n=1 Tax=Albula goreensis TaxID=1534307 RepID=A0A8T3D552_9TELE|nr:hypothetical protein AGOR_G00166440 [Albula goreensis]